MPANLLDVTTTYFASLVGSPLSCNHPATVDDGDLLIVWVNLFGTGGGGGDADVAEFTEMAQAVGSDPWERGSFFRYAANGTEGGTTFDVTLTGGSGSAGGFVTVLRYEAGTWTGTPSGTAQGSPSADQTPDPPEHTPPWRPR